MKIISIDPAEKTGYAYGESMTDYECGLWDFKLKRDENFAFKLLRFKEKFSTLCSSYKPDLVTFERVSGINSAAIMSHSKFVAVIEMYCTENSIPFKGYSASEIKKSATGVGNAKKDLMIKTAIRMFKYRGTDDNVADAICLLNLSILDNAIS